MINCMLYARHPPRPWSPCCMYIYGRAEPRRSLYAITYELDHAAASGAPRKVLGGRDGDVRVLQQAGQDPCRYGLRVTCAAASPCCTYTTEPGRQPDHTLRCGGGGGPAKLVDPSRDGDVRFIQLFLESYGGNSFILSARMHRPGCSPNPCVERAIPTHKAAGQTPPHKRRSGQVCPSYF